MFNILGVSHPKFLKFSGYVVLAYILWNLEKIDLAIIKKSLEMGAFFADNEP